VLAGKLIEGIEGLGVNDGALFNPADFVLLGLDLEEAAAVLEHFQLLAVDHHAYTIGDGGYAVMKVRLADGDVDRLMQHMVETRASAGKRKKTQDQERRN
jgi:hypothetical protein